MRAVWVSAAILGLLAGAPPAASAGADRTHPTVTPAAGHGHTPFILAFELSETAGHSGVFEVAYRVYIRPTTGRRTECLPGQSPRITTGTAGTTMRLRLPPPARARGWCNGKYRVTVFLERGPYCPEPAAGEPPVPCPLFPTREIDTGRAHFTVRPTASRNGLFREVTRSALAEL